MAHKLESDILVVDDEIRLVNNLQTLLGWEGYQTRRASNGQEAIELIEEQPPSLIISDIMMPKVDGYELLAYIKEKFPHIPVIAVTGFGSIDSAIKAMQMGALDYILKPFDHGLIVETVARAAETSRRNWHAALRQKMVAAVGSTLSLDRVMKKVLELSERGTGAENGSLFILDERGQVTQHTLLAQVESPENEQKIIKRVIEKGLAGWLNKNRQSALINNAKQDERWLDLPERNYPVQSVIGVPCISREKVQGIIVLVHSEAEQFDAVDLNFLEAIATPVAMAIENARLFERERHRRKNMTALYETGLKIASTLDKETTAQTVLQQIASLIGVDNCAIAGRNRDDEGLTTYLNLVFREGEWQARGTKENLYLSADYPALPEILSEKKILVKHIADPDLDPTERSWLEKRRIQSLMLCPLPWHKRVMGCIALAHTSQDKQFTTRDKQLMAGLTPQVTTALENARLFETVAMQTVWVEAQAHELEQERRKLAAILHNAADVILAVDKQGTILLANPALEREFDIEYQAIFDRPYRAALQNTPLLDMFDRAKAENRALTLEIESPAGRTYYANVTPVPGMGYMAALRDISHLKALDKMRVEMLSTASHDLKNPLTVIQGFISLLEEMGGLNDRQRDAVKRIDRAVVRMTDLIGDLLDLARLESGLRLQLGLYPFNYLVENTIVNLEDMIKDKEVALTLDLDDALGKINCDPRRIGQALTNLIGNAVKYTPSGGEIIVKTAAVSGAKGKIEKAGVMVSVQDKGYGIEAEHLPHIFDRFYRAHTAQIKNIEGTGLGLAIVKTIIEQHGGEIWVESEEGKGSAFSFTLYN